MEWRIYVVGAGVVGLVSAACYAREGNFVSLYEKDRRKRKEIALGKLSFLEPGLDQLLTDVLEGGHLELVGSPTSAVATSDISQVAVGTPNGKDGGVDTTDVVAACRDIGRGLRKSSRYSVISVRSTVFPGTTSGLLRKTVEKFSGKQAGSDFGMVTIPEFLRGGSAIQNMLHPDRIVLGQLDRRSGDPLEKFLREFHKSDMPPLLRVSTTTAEMIKYASNAFVATKIAFMNEIASLCERFVDVDARDVADGMGYDRRIGRALLDPGFGFGGPCLKKDLVALLEGARRSGVHLRIAEACLMSNELQTRRAIRLARELIGPLRGKRASILGLAYKPGTNDMRDAWSLRIVRELLDARMHVSVYDPASMENALKIFGKTVKYAKSVRDCLEGAECCFIVTEWDEFKAIPPSLFGEAMARPVLIDGRRALDTSTLGPEIVYRTVGANRVSREVTPD